MESVLLIVKLELNVIKLVINLPENIANVGLYFTFIRVMVTRKQTTTDYVFNHTTFSTKERKCLQYISYLSCSKVNGVNA